MPQFKDYHQHQLTFLPQNIKDCLPKDHICFLIDQVVNGLDLKPIENTYKDGGCPAYDPAMLVKIMFYSYTQGIRSSRKIESATYESLAHRYLAANQNPDHGTINLFRNKHLEQLEDIFAEIVILCGWLGMVDFSDASIDGTVIKASASRKNTLDKEQIQKLKKKIREYLREADDIDEQEDKLYGKDKRGINQLPEYLANHELRQKAIDELKRKLKMLDQAESIINEKQNNAKTNKEKKMSCNKSVNTTDPDANLLKLKNGRSFASAYNAQVSASKQVVLAYDIFSEGNDGSYLLPMIEKTESNTGEKIQIIKADSIYFSRENIDGITEKQIDAYIPDMKKSFDEQRENTNSIPEFDRKNFKYDSRKDCFVCPGKHQLPFVNEYQGYRKYICEDCANCKFKSGCIKGKKRYLLIDPTLEKYKQDMRKKLNSKSGKAKYIERMSEVEPVFANILHNLKCRFFHCRSKPRVKIEFGLACIAHNLVKISNFLKQNQDKMQNLENIIKLNTFTRLETVA